jgi:hypothetical protein
MAFAVGSVAPTTITVTAMTRKERILSMVQRQADNVAYADVIRRLMDMQDIEIGLEQIERGDVIDHDELFKRLEQEWRELEAFAGDKGRAR